MITAKIDLTQLQHVVKEMNGKSGPTKCLIIPIDSNNLFTGKNGNVYLDLVGFELKTIGQYGDTHMIKQSLPKDVREKMTDEQKKAMPIFGNMKVSDGPTASTPNVTAADLDLAADEEDLPF